MEPGVGDLPFAVELSLKLSRISFGQHEGMEIISPPSDFSELDTMDAPVFFGQCFFARNNLGEYPDEKFGINCQWDGHEEVRICDGIVGRIFENDRADYSFARLYAEDELHAQVEIFLNPNIFERIYLARNEVNFHLITSFKEHKKIHEHFYKEKNIKPNNIVVEREPAALSNATKFTLDIGQEDSGQWWFRVRLVSLDFSFAESPPASKN